KPEGHMSAADAQPVSHAYLRLPPRQHGAKRTHATYDRSSANDDQYASFCPITAANVFKRILTSSHRLQLFMYHKSRSTRFSIRSTVAVSPRSPLTCAQPVMPGFK